jgi:dihydrodipicolinate synthase/N-acetylneuraminate lyase
MIAPHQLTLVLRHLTPARVIDGMAALVLPFDEDGGADLDALASLVARTYAAGLTPAVNLHAGYVELLTDDQRQDVLTVTAGVARGRRFVAGAYVDVHDVTLTTRYGRELERIARQGGTPILVPCAALTALDEDRIADIHRDVTASYPGTLAMELGRVFASFGRVYSLDLFQRLMDVPTLAGLHHASQERLPEWYRLEARDVRRPEFRIYSGNDLAADMVSCGSDYLLAVAGMSVEAFAQRDRLWSAGDSRVTAVNDLVQYLGSLACRPPSGAYRHSAAQFLHARGIIPSASPHPQSTRRPDTDVELLREIGGRLDALLQTTVDRPLSLEIT